MSRRIHNPVLPVSNTDPLPISKGGTGANTASKAVINLTAIDSSKIGTANGVLGLDENRMAIIANLPTHIKGPDTLYTNTVGTYTITNYDSNRSYTITPIMGAVNRNGNTITYTAPTTPGNGGFSINNRDILVSIVAPHVNKPTITSPVDGATGLSSSVTFTGTAFSTSGLTDTHLNSTWQLAIDRNFTSIFASSTSSTVNLTTWTPTNLPANTTLYVRVKYTGSLLGDSDWSDTITITTKTAFYPTSQLQIISPSDAPNNVSFGSSMDISADGSTLVIGDSKSTVGSYTNAGKVYVYTKSGGIWVQQQILTPSVSTSNSLFGQSVAVSRDGSVIVIGSPGYDNSTGQAFIFVKSGSTWTQQQIINSGTGLNGAKYGYSVDVSNDGNTIIIGAISDNSSTYTGVGQLYVYVRSGSIWSRQLILYASDRANISSSAAFGRSISISNDGNTAIVGAPGAISSGYTGAGQAYVFTRTGSVWTQQQILTASDRANNAQFGYDVSISGDASTLIIGANTVASGGVSGAGQAYVFTKTGTVWTQQSILTAINRQANNQFGYTVSVSYDGNIAVVGSYSANVSHVFTRSSNIWTAQQPLSPSPLSSNMLSGQDICISNDGNFAFIAVSGYDNIGKVFAFS